ncbi:MAG: hypothetical protein KDE45_22925, partial [Caldilineaceae bacterium]|nr:hypothetical protein [Caldilineaceae bacterium]
LQAPNTPVTVTNSLFLQNTTTNNVGGALAASASFGIVAPVLISGSTFLSNTAQCLGGTFGICEAPAVYLFDQDVRIVNSRFEDNRCTAANCDGGGVFMLSSFNAPAMRIENSDFLGNTAGGSGGGVSVGNLAQFVVVNGRFENNRALAGDGGGLNHGNFLIAAFADVSGTQFISNSAALEGGGLNSVSDVAIRGARFERNASSTDGGGLFVDFGGAGSRLTNTLFLSNTAQSEGGGAFVFGDGLIVSGGSFVGNSATADGGGLHACGSVTLTNPVFSGNVTQENGGGAYVGPRENIGGCGSGANSVAVSDGRFEANRSLDPPTFFSEGGGGLYVLGSATLTNTDFLANQAAALGGGVYVQESAVLSSGSFQNNVAAGSNGGGIRAAGSLTVDGTQFVGNVAGFAGGGAQVGNTLGSGQSIIRNALFQNNQADSGGGLQSSITLTLDNVQFLSNVAITTSGGGLSAFDALTVTNSLFQGNSSAGNGGGLNSFSGPFILANTQFLGNAALNGGGLYYAFNALSATDVTIQGNSAISNGGGLATSGSAVFSGSWTVSGNTAGQDGGGIWANSGLNAVGGRIENNRSLGNGGGFYGGLAQMRVDGTVFALNRTAGSGGGAYAFDGAAIGNALFSGNTANGAGGGLFLQRFVHITATQFLGNRDGKGGGLAVIRSSTGTLVQDITNSVFARNTATGRGADFFYDQPRPINLLHNTFARDGQAVGAAVYVAAGTVAIT